MKRFDPKAKFGVNTYSFTLTHRAQDCLETLAPLGFSQFELMMYPGHLWPNDMSSSERQRFKKFLNDGGHEVVSLNQPNVDINIGAANPEMRAYTLDLLAGIIDFAGDIGAPNFIMGPGKQNPLMAVPEKVMLGHFYRALEHLAPRAQAAGVTILVENMPFAFLPRADQIMSALAEFGDDSIGTIYDVANGAFIDEDIAQGLAKMLPRLKMVHISDTGPTVYKHDPIGQGSIDFAGLKSTLENLNWTAPPVLEIIAQTNDPVADLQSSIDQLARLGW